jgi:rhodanese-related sulfurtransferase/biotin operon repressor
MNKPLSPKKRLYEHFARVAKAMASPNRLELMEALAQGERSVEALAIVTGMSVANTSHHLQTLRDAGLAVSRKEGLQVIYALGDDQIPAVLAGIRHVAERRSAEVERIVRENFDRRDEMTPVKREELLKMVRAGKALVIDVRPEQEYRAGHIAGALNVPVERLPRLLAKLPKQQEIVAYCRGPYCMFALEAVEHLRKKGFHARRLEEGYPEWKASRLPVEEEAG